MLLRSIIISNHLCPRNTGRGDFFLPCQNIFVNLQRGLTIDNMPTIFKIFGLRFMFFSDDHEPIHVHIIKDGCEAKFNV